MKSARLSAASAPTFATAAVIVIMAVVVARAFGGPELLAGVLIIAAAVLIASGFRNIPPRLRQTAFVLLAVTVVLLPLATSPLQAIQRGVFVSGQLLALMASVLLLAQCALRNPRVLAVGASLRAQHPGRRYLAFTVTSQLFSGMLGMAGAHIMLVMAAPEHEPTGEHKTASVIAVTRGFATAGFWSPVFGNMVILLALYPSINWLEIFPVGLALAQISLLVGLLINKMNARRKISLGLNSVQVVQPVSEPDPVALPQPTSAPGVHLLSEAAPLLAAMAGFMAIVLFVSKLIGIGITATLVLLGPITAFGLHAAMSAPGRRIAQSVQHLRTSTLLYPRLASEAILFLAAGCAGSIMADAFPAEWALLIGRELGGHPFFALALLVASIIGLSLAGVHPVLSAVFLASTVTPEVLKLPPITHMGALLTGWGLAAIVTPFSVLSLTASRYSGASLVQISFGRNWAFTLISSVLACAALTGLTLVIE